MIEFPRDQQDIIPAASLKIIGLGGAGANMLDRIALDGIEGAELAAMNTDARTLAGAVAAEKIPLGRNLTKGLGAGGDPELGQQAVLEAEKEIRAAIKGRRIIFLCVGLGGGTGSGGAPIITRIAREEGAFVVVFATMPFVFEGKRRRDQAETALNELAVLSNALVTFDNNRMGELVLAKQGIHEAFVVADRMISESIKAVIRLVVRPGLIHIGLDELMSALRTTRSRCLFGSGIAGGKDRAARALRAALSSPLLDQGALLKDAESVLVHLCGGEDLTLYEIELLMRGLLKYVPEKAHVLFGAAIDPAMGANLSITLISALPEDCLAAAPRQALTRIAADDPSLDPSVGYTGGARKEAEDTPEPIPAAPAATPTPISTSISTPAPARLSPAPPPAPAKPAAAPTKPAPVFESPFAEPQAATSQAEAPPAKAAPARAPEPPAEPPQAAAPLATPKPVSDLEEMLDGPDPAQSISDSAEWSDPFSYDGFPDDLPPANPDEAAGQDESQQATSSTMEIPVLRPKMKIPAAQPELLFDGGPKGRFAGEKPNIFEGEDLDIPPFLRKKKV